MKSLFDFSTDDLEKGRKLFAAECTFVKGAVSMETLPPADLEEVAFIGRSNVGKSSLINALTNRKTLARTSSTPGRTQELNFFNLGDKLMLADLPGYGFAAAPKKQVKNWTHTIKDYLRGRRTLKRVCVLIDSRHPFKKHDEEMMTLLDEAAVSYLLVLTKADLPTQSKLDYNLSKLAEIMPKHPAAYPEYLLTSGKKGLGLDKLRAHLAKV